MTDTAFIRKVLLKNYKSIASCSVELGPLNFLVGPNGAGKSNFLDALRLVTDALNTTLDHALRDRGGINEVRRRSSGHPRHFSIQLELQLPDAGHAVYAFEVGAKPDGAFQVKREECRIRGLMGEEQYFLVESGKVIKSTEGLSAPASADRLYLVMAGGIPAFRPVYDLLAHMGFYNLNPDVIRDLQPCDSGKVLGRDGRNIASILRLMEKRKSKDLVIEFLSKIVQGIEDARAINVGSKESIEFRQTVGANEAPWRFMAENMSDGTLRALGVLIALFQSLDNPEMLVPLVGIEEPEVALHPGAAEVLREALIAASRHTQVIVTSHSPELLDDDSIKDGWILPVENLRGETRIGRLGDAERSSIREKLYTAGELLRMNQLTPDPQSADGGHAETPDFFENEQA